MTATGQPSSPARRRPRYRCRRRRAGLVVALAVLILAVTAAADWSYLGSRPARAPVTLPSPATPTATPVNPGLWAPSPAPADTWLVLGTDSREAVPAGPNHYGTTDDVVGARADVVVLLQPTRQGVTALTLPRDLVLTGDNGTPQRLTTSYLDGTQATVDLLCSSLGVTTTHVVVFDMAQFAAVVDALGGVTVDVESPMRDTFSGLDLPRTGSQRLDGVTALALVRSRHTEVLTDGTWTALSEADGAAHRSRYTSLVLGAVAEEIARQARNPARAQVLATELLGQVTLDSGTSLADLAGLAWALRQADSPTLVTVPAPTLGDTFVAPVTTDTLNTLADYGYAPGRCTPAP